MAVSVAFKAKDEGLSAANKRYTREAKEHSDAIRRTGQESRRAQRQQTQDNERLGRELGSLVTRYTAIQTALSGIISRYQTWVQLERERATLTKSSVDAARNLALLQRDVTPEARRERITQAAAMAAGMGVFRTEEEQAAAFDVIQAMQSAAGGDFGAGMRRARAIFQAQQIGLQPQTARELINQAIAQGQQDPTSFLRMGFTAGQLSLRTPEEVSRSVRGLQLFEDKSFGFSVAGVLTDVFKEQSETFVVNSAKALAIQADRAALGVSTDATNREVFRAIADRGVTTLEQARAIGIQDVRAQRAIVALVERAPEVFREAEAIRAADRPGLLAREQRELERDPLFATRRAQAIAQSQTELLRMFDIQSLQNQVERTQTAIDLLRSGRRDFTLQEGGDLTTLQNIMGQVILGTRLTEIENAIPGLGSEVQAERLQAIQQAMEDVRDILRGDEGDRGANPALPNRPAS